jgi:hypothetical protein
VVDKGLLGGKDGEAGSQASDSVDAVRVIKEVLVGEEVGLGGVPRGEDALVSLDQAVDIALLETFVAAAAEKASRDAGGQGEDAEEAHGDGGERVSG